MATHPFLSDAWIEAARIIHDEFKGSIDDPTESLRLNVTVTDAPFSDANVLGHVDTTAGSAVPDKGHIDNPDLTVRIPYDMARNILIEQQPDTLMIAFMSGEIEVEGDITRLFALQDIEATPQQQSLAEEIAGRLKAITE